MLLRWSWIDTTLGYQIGNIKTLCYSFNITYQVQADSLWRWWRCCKSEDWSKSFSGGYPTMGQCDVLCNYVCATLCKVDSWICFKIINTFIVFINICRNDSLMCRICAAKERNGYVKEEDEWLCWSLSGYDLSFYGNFKTDLQNILQTIMTNVNLYRKYILNPT